MISVTRIISIVTLALMTACGAVAQGEVKVPAPEPVLVKREMNPALDESWKGGFDGKNPMVKAEKHWGLYNTDRSPKKALR